MTGFYLMHRGWLDHPVLQGESYDRRSAWAWLIEEAKWQDRRCEIGGRIVDLKRGQLSHSTRFMGKAWGWSEARVRRFLTRLKTDAMIDAETDAGRYLISICNYGKYQAGTPEGDAPSDAPSDAEATQQRRKPKEGKEGKKPTSGTLLSFPSSDHHAGGQKENAVHGGSSEDLFWSLVDKAAAVNVARSLMGKLAGAMGDFDKAYPALLGALDKKNPPAYVAAIIKNEKQEQAARDAAAEGRDSGEPGFVQEAYRAGQPVERLPGNTWRIAGTIYDATGEEVGW